MDGGRCDRLRHGACRPPPFARLATPPREEIAVSAPQAGATVEVALASEDMLGEGPVWRAQTQELLRVDIARGLVHAWHPQSGRLATLSMDGEASAVMLCRDGSLIVAVDHDLVLLGADEALHTFATDEASRMAAGAVEPPQTIAGVERDRPHSRFNDCRCDPQGRLWAGTMSKQREPGAAGLYRLDRERRLELVIGATTISNGIGWSPDGQRMYFIDSTTQRIDLFDFDSRDGAVSGRRRFAAIDPQDGLPDGLAVDSEGGVWVCLFGGGALRRYSPEGRLEWHVALPVPHATCPAFGGDDLSTLFITTTRHRLSAQQLPEFPAAGSVLALQPGVTGMEASLCEIG